MDTQWNVSQNRSGHGDDEEILAPNAIEFKALRPQLVTLNIGTDIQTPRNDAATDSVHCACQQRVAYNRRALKVYMTKARTRTRTRLKFTTRR
jgi:hypothetical protein